MAKKTYLQESYEHSQRMWSQWMGSQMSRRFVIKAGTLAALGGSTALAQIMAACAGGAARETSVGGELEAGAFKYSRFPLVEKYNWRLVKWDMTPYYGGEYREDSNPVSTFNILRNSPSTPGGRWWQTLYRLHYGPGTETAGWPVPPMDFEDTDGPVRIEQGAAAEMPKKAPDFSWYEVKLRPDLFFHYNPNADAPADVKAMIEKVGGRNVTADDELGPYYQHNPTEAKRLMAEAGFPNGYAAEMVTTATTAATASYVAVQQQLAEVGIRLKFKEVETAVATALRVAKDFKDFIAGNQDSGYDTEMNIYRLWASKDAVRNYGSVDDAILADLAQKQRYELDYEERREMARQVHACYLEIIPTFHILSQHRMTIRHPWIHNWGDNIHLWLCCWGSQQVRQMFLDDTAAGGRGGKRGKEGTWGVPYDRQGRKV